MKTISIKEYEICHTHFLIPENQYNPFKAFCTKKDNKNIKKLKINTIQKKIDGKNIREIELTATSYVGIFNLPDIDKSTLIVRPKIGAPAFLQMLKFIDEQNIIIQNIFAHGMQDSSDFIDIFIHFLIQTLHDLVLNSKRKGYDLTQHDLPYIKGRVNYLKTIQNRVKSSNLASCEYFQFNSNTLINKAIKFTLTQIRDIIPIKSIMKFRDILKMLDDVDISDFILEDFNRITYNRLNIKYRDILTFCFLILKNQMISLEVGKTVFPAFCFNSWNIFEAFIRKILKIHCSRKYIVEKKRYYTKNEPVDPDIVLKNRNTGDNDLVIDVKYKKYWNKNDYNQIFTFKRSINAKKGMLIYPQRINRKSKAEFSYEFFDFNEWIDKKENYLESFTEKILNFIST